MAWVREANWSKNHWGPDLCHKMREIYTRSRSDTLTYNEKQTGEKISKSVELALIIDDTPKHLVQDAHPRKEDKNMIQNPGYQEPSRRLI